MMKNRIKEKRKEAGLSQYDLADILETSQVVLCNYESGRTIPRVDRAIRVANALNTTVEELWGDVHQD